MFSLIVPVLYNFEGCTKLLASVDEPFVPIIVNNWHENRGVAGGWNYGITKSLEMGIDQFVIMNDDTYFEPGSRPSQLIKELDETTGFVMGEVGFAYFATNKAALDKIGWFDENIYPGYFEDNDFAYRTKLANLQYKGLIHSKVVHEGSKTQFWNGREEGKKTVSSAQFEANRAYYIKKWGGGPGEEIFPVAFDGKEPEPKYHSPDYRREH
jgi:GT2 family glycosyltransferase